MSLECTLWQNFISNQIKKIYSLQFSYNFFLCDYFAVYTTKEIRYTKKQLSKKKTKNFKWISNFHHSNKFHVYIIQTKF